MQRQVPHATAVRVQSAPCPRAQTGASPVWKEAMACLRLKKAMTQWNQRQSLPLRGQIVRRREHCRVGLANSLRLPRPATGPDVKKTAPELRSGGTSTGAGGRGERCSLLMLTIIDLEDILGPMRATCVWMFLGWTSNHTNIRSLAVLARHRMHRPYSRNVDSVGFLCF